MVIVNLKQCLAQLSNDVKQKIIKKQSETVQKEYPNDLAERLQNREFRKELLTNLSALEKKQLITFLNKYGCYLKNSANEEQIISNEEKLALLLLRQKGIIFKLDGKLWNQQFVIPIEFFESYFELNFLQEKGKLTHEFISAEQYLYLLIELIFHVKEKQNLSMLDFELLKKRYSKTANWGLLLNYLVNEGLVVKSKKEELVVIEDRCRLFFQKTKTEIKRLLTSFILWEYLENPIAVNFIAWSLFSHGGGYKQKELYEYIKRNTKLSKKTFEQAISQLFILQIISTGSDERIYVTKTEEEVENGIGIEVGILEFVLPVTVDNQALWAFRCWGKFVKWDVMVHIGITAETVSNALKAEQDETILKSYLKSYLSENTINSWEGTFNQWFNEAKPITKKGQLVFYSITERLHLKFIEEHWLGWWEKTPNGVIINEESVAEFEKLLNKLSLNVICSKKQIHIEEQQIRLGLVNEYPNLSVAFPELDSLPKQWFILTAYDERIIQRIVKQAIILQLTVKIETESKKDYSLLPLEIINVNGSYEVVTKEKVKIRMVDICKIALIHPLNN